MEIHEAEPGDAESIRAVARRSLEASYPLSPQAIDNAVTEWYGDDVLAEKLDDPDVLLLVAEREPDGGSEVIGFTESVLVDEEHDAEVLWLNVDPDYRDLGVGSKLFEQTHERLAGMGVEKLRGRVLAVNSEGNAFYEDRGFLKVGQDRVEIDGRRYVENVYVEAEPSGMMSVATDDGREVYVDRDNADPGSVAPFFVVFTDADRENTYGYYCGSCDSLANAMDAMGRIECDNCGNTRKPTRWDAAYL